MSLMLAASILVIAPVAQVDQMDAAYEEIATGRDAQAVERLEDAPGAEDHPAALINLGIAKARIGDTAEARRQFTRAASMTQRFELETSAGDWVDSRTLALRALAALDRGAFARDVQTAMR